VRKRKGVNGENGFLVSPFPFWRVVQTSSGTLRVLRSPESLTLGSAQPLGASTTLEGYQVRGFEYRLTKSKGAGRLFRPFPFRLFPPC